MGEGEGSTLELKGATAGSAEHSMRDVLSDEGRAAICIRADEERMGGGSCEERRGELTAERGER